MKIALVTTYPPMECAIGIYTQKLMRAMVAEWKEASVYIIGEDGAGVSSEPGIQSEPVYRRDEDYQDKIFHFAMSNQIDVVHFQHAPDLFGMDDRLPDLLAKLQAANIKTVVTLHTIYNRPLWRERFDRVVERDKRKLDDAEFHQRLAQHTDRIIVHQHQDTVDVLVSQGVASEKIAVIPHGTTEMETMDSRVAKRLLGIHEDAFVFLFFGFIHMQKNVHTAVSAFSRIAKKYPQARLVVAGKPWGGRFYNEWYVRYMKTQIRLTNKRRQIDIRDCYVSKHDVAAYFSAADVMLLPHWQKYGSASGVFHQTIGAQKPLIVANGPKFADGAQLLRDAGLSVLTPPPHRPSNWAAAMACLMDDPATYQKAATVLSDYAKDSLWPAVAEKHRKIYEALGGE